MSCLEEDIEALAVTSRFLTLCNIAPVLGNIFFFIVNFALIFKNTYIGGKLNNYLLLTLKAVTLVLITRVKQCFYSW